ncbi:hypothetical protein CCP3SC1_60033 [Gammaproteobacteria bacterium]
MFDLFKSKKVPPGMIGETARINALFQTVKEQGAVVSLRIAGSEVWYNSTLVAMEPRQGLLALERIQEENGHQRMIRVRRFHAMTRCKGVLSFNAELLPGIKEGQTRYVIRMPEAVEYQERRTGSISLSTTAPSAITLMGMGRVARGYLSDISLTDLELRTRDIVPFRPEEEVASCTFQLPGGLSVSCRLKVISTQLDTIAHETRVRGELLDLPEFQRRELDRTLAELAQA